MLARHLMTLGWSERELGRRLGRSQSDVRRVLAGTQELTETESAWVVKLSDFMRANPPPRRRELFEVGRRGRPARAAD